MFSFSLWDLGLTISYPLYTKNVQIAARSVNVELQLVKVKTFDMAPISLDEALQALALIDHPFYVFRNKVSFKFYTLCLLLVADAVHVGFCIFCVLRRPTK